MDVYRQNQSVVWGIWGRQTLKKMIVRFSGKATKTLFTQCYSWIMSVKAWFQQENICQIYNTLKEEQLKCVFYHIQSIQIDLPKVNQRNLYLLIVVVFGMEIWLLVMHEDLGSFSKTVWSSHDGIHGGRGIRVGSLRSSSVTLWAQGQQPGMRGPETDRQRQRNGDRQTEGEWEDRTCRESINSGYFIIPLSFPELLNKLTFSHSLILCLLVSRVQCLWNHLLRCHWRMFRC